MPKLNPNAQEQTENNLPTKVEPVVQEMVLSSKPVLICGVNRKINTGNFENIDVYAALSIPLEYMPTDETQLRQMVAAAAEVGFEITSGETGERYELIKNLQKGGR